MRDAKMFAERRQYPRVPINIPIRYRMIDDQKEIDSLLERRRKDQTTKTIDVSLGGLYIGADESLRVGSILRLEITVPEKGGSISAFAEVVWVNETGGGLRFLAMKEEDADYLKAYLKKNEQ